MTKKQILLYFLAGISLGIILGTAVAFSSPVFRTSIGQIFHKEEDKAIEALDTPKVRNKSQQEKQAQMEEDAERMNELFLYYDYDQLTLEDTVKTYLNEFGFSEGSVAFTYKPISYDQVIDYRSDTLVPIGLMDALPINLTVNESKEELEELIASDELDELQYYSLAYQDISSTLYLASLVGGIDEVYSILEKYGKVTTTSIETMSLDQDQTTTDFIAQLMEFMWEHQENYANIFDVLLEAYQNRYYDTLIEADRVLQYPSDQDDGTIQLASIVYEATPYIIVLTTEGLTEYDLTQLAYVINEWHRVNLN